MSHVKSTEPYKVSREPDASMGRWRDALSSRKDLLANGTLTAVGGKTSEDMIMGGMASNGITKSQRRTQRKEIKACAQVLNDGPSTALIGGNAQGSTMSQLVDREIIKAQKRQRRRENRALKRQKKGEERAKALSAAEPLTAVFDETSQAMVMKSTTSSSLTAPLTKRQRKEANRITAASTNVSSRALGDKFSLDSVLGGMTRSGISKLPRNNRKDQKVKGSSQKSVADGMASNGITKAHQRTLKAKTRRDRARAEKLLLANFVVPDGPQETSGISSRSVTAEHKIDRFHFRQRNKWDPDKLLSEIEKLTLDPGVSAFEYDRALLPVILANKTL